MGRLFQLTAVTEAFTWAGLLVGMFLKHVTGTTEAGVRIFGSLHGAVFILYLMVTIAAAVSLRWGWKVAAGAILAAVPPLLTVLAERRIAAKGHLAHPAVRDAVAGR